MDLSPRTVVPTAVGRKRKRPVAAIVVLVVVLLAGGVMVAKFLTSAINYYCNVDEVGHKSGCETGRRLRIQGTAVVIDGTQVDLSEREADVLRVLAERSGAVVSKPQLLREVWNGTSDPHVVEVTIGRLRRRLGDLGSAIRVVPRRGYVLVRDA